jgi:hypothetical protein
MNKIKQLKDSRNQKIKEMRAITEAMDKEKRSVKTEEERTKFEGLKSEIEALDKEIEDAEFEERAKIEEIKKDPKPEGGEDKELKRYDLFKAMREGANPTGFEKEMRDEARKEIKEARGDFNDTGIQIPAAVLKRAVFDTTAGADVTKVNQVPNLSTHDKRLVSSQMPITIYEGLNGKLELPSMADITASFTAENAAVSDVDPSVAKETIEPTFVSANSPFSKQYLNQTDPRIQNQILNQFNYAISKAVEKRLFDAVYALTAKAGYEAATLWPAGEEYSLLLEMEADLEYGNGILVSNDVKAIMKNKFVDPGSGIRIWKDNEVNGYGAFATSLLAANSVIMGSWEDAVIGYWGGMEIILDPFTKKRNGQMDIQVSRLADAAVANPASFSVVKNYAK